jgi:hypothetical protein
MKAIHCTILNHGKCLNASEPLNDKLSRRRGEQMTDSLGLTRARPRRICYLSFVICHVLGRSPGTNLAFLSEAIQTGAIDL